MDCTIEATPHPIAGAYLSTYDGGGVIQEFEVENADEVKSQKALDKEQMGMDLLLRSEGAYSSPTNPWPMGPVWRVLLNNLFGDTHHE